MGSKPSKVPNSKSSLGSNSPQRTTIWATPSSFRSLRDLLSEEIVEMLTPSRITTDPCRVAHPNSPFQHCSLGQLALLLFLYSSYPILSILFFPYLPFSIFLYIPFITAYLCICLRPYNLLKLRRHLLCRTHCAVWKKASNTFCVPKLSPSLALHRWTDASRNMAILM